METPKVLINPVMQWAVELKSIGTIRYVNGLPKVPMAIPHVGDVLTVDFMVDPQTLVPCPVQVTQLLYDWMGTGHRVGVVVVRAKVPEPDAPRR